MNYRVTFRLRKEQSKVNQKDQVILPGFPKPFKGVKIVPAELEAHFKAGKSLEEIAAVYGIKKDSLRAKIRNSASLTERMRRGKAYFESLAD